jgi:hypothetical protein
MADTDISQTTISDLKSTISAYSISPRETEGAMDQEETYYDNTNWTQWFAYWKEIPELKTAINGFATWVLGKGWAADGRVTALLEGMDGWGEDTFNSIMWNMIVTKKIGGDAFAEIIRNPDTGTLLNLKPLDPGSIRIIANRQGRIKRYEQRTKRGNKTAIKKFQPQDILHLCNDRIADEIHGTGVTEACEWVILARAEAMTSFKTVLRRNINPLKIFELDTDDTTKRDAFITQYQNMTKDHEALFIPKGNAAVTIPPIPLQDPLPWIKYLENFFYQAVGVPKVILGGSEEFTEASSKISYLTFEQVYTRETTEIEADLWNQCAIRITFNKPASIKNELLQSEDKNTGQVGFQPSETTASLTRNE